MDDALHFTTGEEEQKGKNLAANPEVLLTTGRLDWQAGIDIVVEGSATRPNDQALLERLALAWRERWDGSWHFEARDGRFYHAGGSEVAAYSVQPRKVMAFAQGAFAHTSHRFA